MSIQEQWYRKSRNGGLGYQYPMRGYGFYGGMITDNHKSIQEQEHDELLNINKVSKSKKTLDELDAKYSKVINNVNETLKDAQPYIKQYNMIQEKVKQREIDALDDINKEIELGITNEELDNIKSIEETLIEYGKKTEQDAEQLLKDIKSKDLFKEGYDAIRDPDTKKFKSKTAINYILTTYNNKLKRDLKNKLIDDGIYTKKTSAEQIYNDPEFRKKLNTEIKNDDYLLGIGMSIRAKNNEIKAEEDLKAVNQMNGLILTKKDEIKLIENQIQELYKKALDDYNGLYGTQLKNVTKQLKQTLDKEIIDKDELNKLNDSITTKNEEIKKIEKDILDKNISYTPIIEYHEELTTEKGNISNTNEELYDNILNETLPESNITFNTWINDTNIEYINTLKDDLKNSVVPTEINGDTLQTIMNERREQAREEAKASGTYNEDKEKHIMKHITRASVFEDLDYYNDDLLYNIIHKLDPEFKRTGIKKTIKINSNSYYEDDDIKFKGDNFAPIDNIIIIRYNDGSEVKYAIENKFYNTVDLYTAGKNKLGRSKVKFNDIIKLNESKFNEYKKSLLAQFTETKTDYDTMLEDMTPEQIKETNPALYNNYHNTLNTLKNDNNLTEQFYKEVYIPNIAMKLSKTNYQYAYAKHQEGSVTSPKYHEYAKTMKPGKTRVKYNKDGTIEGIYNASSEAKFGTVNASGKTNYDLFNGAKVLYMVSFDDAVVGMNWTDKLKTLSSKHPEFLNDPTFLRHPTASAYGSVKNEKTGIERYYTDSLSFRPTDFISLNVKKTGGSIIKRKRRYIN